MFCRSLLGGQGGGRARRPPQERNNGKNGGGMCGEFSDKSLKPDIRTTEKSLGKK